MNMSEVTPHFQLGGICRIGKIPFTLSAGSDNNGFLFIGKLLSGTILSMADVINMLGERFQINTIPEPVRTLNLSNLGFSYHTGSKTFEFVCTGGFKVAEVPVEMSVYIAVGDHSSITFQGRLTIHELNFTVRFDTDDCRRNVFVAAYQPSGPAPVSLHDLVKSVSEPASRYIPTSFVIDLQRAEFIFYEQDEQKQFLFGLQLSSSINLKEIPVVGDKLPDQVKLAVNNLQFLFASASFAQEQVTAVTPLLSKEIHALLADGLAKGMHISGELYVMDFMIPLHTGNKESQTSDTLRQYQDTFKGRATMLDSATPVSPDQITWFDVKKKLGPISFQRVGVAFADNTLSFALDASLTMGPAQLTMSGLTVGSSLSKFEPVFGLQGFFLSLKTSGFELGGGFLKSTTDGVDSYYGTVLAQAGTFSFTALGGHTPSHKKNKDSDEIIPGSFFIYAHVEIPLGGPPYFNLKGFAGGFGINNRLILPTLEKLPEYILLPGPKSNAPKQLSTPEDTIKDVLPQMKEYFIPEAGQYWVAAGIYFSSFQMIEAFAVVTVSFGVEFQIALLGSCTMTLPKGTSKPIAYIEIVIMACYTQSSGLLAVVGLITPASYILGDFCRLTGGFAFYIWIDPPQVTGGPRSGDFMVSVGGYHPQFEAPAYYPKLPRVGIVFNLSPLQVTGEAYFAMTPSMLMAGGKLNAVWKLGILKAWFCLSIDFIIAWAPFRYYAAGYVNIGCSVDLGLFTLKVSISVQIDIWGPPFGGKAVVDLSIVKFTIHFGGKKEVDAPLLTWTEFREKFLPADTVTESNDDSSSDCCETNILKATVSAGLNNADVCELDWVIDPDHFVIRISTFIPANKLSIGTGGDTFKVLSSESTAYNHHTPPVERDDMPYLVHRDSANRFSGTQVWNPSIHIKPMGKNNLDSMLNFSLLAMDSGGEYSHCTLQLTVRPVIEDAAGALWDKYVGDTKVDAPAFLSSALVGVELSPIPRIPSMVNNVPFEVLLFKQGNHYRYGYEKLAVDQSCHLTHRTLDSNTLEITVQENTKEPIKLINKEYVLSAMIDNETGRRRDAILQNLVDVGFDVYSQADLTCYGSLTALIDWPEILKLGDSIVE